MGSRRFGSALAGLTLGLALAAPVGAEEPDPVAYQRQEGPLSGAARTIARVGRPVFDVAVQRPVEAVGLVTGAIVFVPAYPVAWLFGAEDDAVRLCLVDPWRRVTRPGLGGL